MPNMHHKGQAYLKLHPQIKQQLNAFTYLLLGNYIAKKKQNCLKEMKKMDYEKPTAEMIRFSVEDMLMDGELPPIGGSTDSGVIYDADIW